MPCAATAVPQGASITQIPTARAAQIALHGFLLSLLTEAESAPMSCVLNHLGYFRQKTLPDREMIQDIFRETVGRFMLFTLAKLWHILHCVSGGVTLHGM